VTPTRALAALAVLALAAGAGCADEDGTVPAATANGIEITSQDVVDELEAIRGNTEFLAQTEEQLAQQGLSVVGGEDEDDTFNSAFVAQTLTNRILYAIVESEVDARGIEIDDECRAAAEESATSESGGEEIFGAFTPAYQDYLVDRLADLIALQGDLAGYTCTVQDDDALLEAYFDEHADEFTRRCVILAQFAQPAAAEDFRAQVAAGGDFATLGAALPADVGQFSDVGCDSTQEILEVIPSMADLAVGEVSPVVLAGDIPVVLRVEQILEGDFTEQRDAVVSAVSAEIDEAFSAWLDEELRAADVTVDPRYGTWNASPDSGGLPAIERPVTDTTESTEPEAQLVPEN
jgi:hypothetical protein